VFFVATSSVCYIMQSKFAEELASPE